MKRRPRRFATNPLGEGLNLYGRGGWRGQLSRVRRWHGRLRTADPDAYLDCLYAFFQNCNHLADWVANDAPGGTARVRAVLDETVELRICRDICNATKHFTLDRHPRVEGGFADGREYLPQGWPTDHPSQCSSLPLE